MSDAPASAGTIERREEVAEKENRDKAVVKFWLDALNLASEDEKDWRDEAEKTVRRFRAERGEHKNQRYRLLYSNTETMSPALFNSLPVPDIRRRYGDRDPDGQAISQALERVISCNAEKSDFEDVMEEVVLHYLLPSRAVARVRYVPSFAPMMGPDGQPVLNDAGKPVEELANEAVNWETVPWSDFRHGPGKRWGDVPWCAFRIFPTREELERLSPDHGGKVPLNAKQGDGELRNDQARNPPSIYKRAEVWQIWDKEKHQIVYVSPDYLDAPIAIVDDELKLEGFFPTPKPLLAVRSPDDLRPIVLYEQYASLAEELEEITKRLRKLVRAARYRGVTAKELGTAFSALQNADDGQFVPADDALVFTQEGGIDKGIWTMPLAELMATIRGLYEARDQTKLAIYEVMGLSDIMRGSTEAQETATAQDIKAQFGSQRISKHQRAIQRYCRDLYRLGVEIVSTRFDPKSIMLAAGVQLSEQQVSLLRRDTMREYRIDVETDSTIRADQTRQQQNVGQFVQGFGALMTALSGPVQAGYMKGDEAADLLTGFARSFKLGKQAEDALERMGDRMRQESQNPQQKPDPAMVEAQAEAAKQQQEMQFKQQAHAMDMQAKEAELAMKAKELELREREAQIRMQELDMTHRCKMAELQAGAALAHQRHTLDLEKLEASRAVGVPPVGAQN